MIIRAINDPVEVKAICHSIGYDETSRKADDINILIVNQAQGGALLSVWGIPQLSGRIELTRILEEENHAYRVTNPEGS